MPVIETALTRLLGIEHPILLAPMGSGGGRTRTQLVLAQFEEARR